MFPRGVTSGPSRTRAEAGETLIELMVAVLVMGLAIVAILAGITTMITTSAYHRGSVRAGNEATTIAELIQGAPYECPGTYATAYAPPAYTKPTGYTVTVATPKYLDSRTTSTPTFGRTTCTAATDQGLQSITVTVRANRSGRNATESVTIVKQKLP